jgi:hypothetical protein
MNVLSRGAAAAVIAPFGISFETIQKAEFVAKAALEGETAGHLVRRLNTLKPAAAPYICIGDPAVQVAEKKCQRIEFRTRQRVPDRAPLDDAKPEEPGVIAPKSQLSVFTRYLQRRFEAVGLPQPEKEKIESSCWQCAATATIISRTAAPYFGFEDFARERSEPEPAPGDHGCGARLLKFTYRVVDLVDYPYSGDRKRVTWLCPRCGIVADVPETMECPFMMVTDEHEVLLTLSSSTLKSEAWLSVAWEPLGAHIVSPAKPIFVHQLVGQHSIRLNQQEAERGLAWVGAVAAWRDDIAVFRAAVYLNGVS